MGASLRALAVGAALAVVLAISGCGGTLDAGRNHPHGMLPVDERSPIIISQDDWSADWLGPLAVMLASNGGPPLAGVIVNGTPFWPDVNANAAGWRDLLAAASTSGIANLPEVTPSSGKPLSRPADGQIDATMPNRSEGAQRILTLSHLARPSRPVVVVSATSLTDLADAYLIDPTVRDRVVVVAALGFYRAPNGVMSGPNGDMDAWADWIVAQRYRFVQVGTYYDQTADVTTTQLADLPTNALGAFITKAQPKIIPVDSAADQVALLSVALPAFVGGVQRVSPDLTGVFDASQGPTLVPDAIGDDLVVTEIDGTLAASTLWRLLLDPRTFGG